MNRLSDRHNFYLRLIIESYISIGEPISSGYLKSKHQLKHSSALIRLIMADLEKEGHLEKPHTSGGRIPSVKGYQYYAQYLATDNEQDLLNKLEDLFAKRRLSIEETIHKSAQIISDMVGSTMITSTDNSYELLRSIQLTVLDERHSVVVLVTSLGRVESKLLQIDNSLVNNEDVRIAIRLFKDRLINAPLISLSDLISSMTPLLATQVKNYETLIQQFVNNIFTFSVSNQNNVYNKNNLILSKEISRKKLTELLDLIENSSIWESIEGKLEEEQTLKIEVNADHTSLISKKFSFEGNNIKEISFVGSNRLDYNKVLTAIKFIEKNLKKKEKE